MMPTPSRPTTPSPKTWTVATPSANLVRRHYVNSRIHDLAKDQATLEERTMELLASEPTLAAQVKGKTSEEKKKFFQQIYYRMTFSLQRSPLTINFNAGDWFGQENLTETYSQCYERAVDPATGKMNLRSNLVQRAGVDDVITFPQAWQNKPAEPKRNGPGLKPGAQQPGHSILPYMMAGKTLDRSKLLNASGAYDDAALQANLVQTNPGSLQKKFDSTNKKFNPKTKQVFAALNYGRRPQGAITMYGNDHLVLNDSFKTDALYYPHDTYDLAARLDQQVSFDMLGVIYLKSKAIMRQQLLPTCINNMRLTDNSSNCDLLLEAHLFTDVRFRGGVEEMVVSGLDGKYLENAKKFCEKNGIKLVQS